MAEAIIKTPKSEKKFSNYPEAMDKYFLDKEIIIKMLPSDLLTDLEKKFLNFRVTNAKEYCDYLDTQITFWEENDPKQIFREFSRIETLKAAKRNFDDALKYYISSLQNIPQGQRNLDLSIKATAQGSLYCNTTLAKILLGYKDKDANFLKGFRYGLLENCNISFSITRTVLEGFVAALEYRKKLKNILPMDSVAFSNFNESLAMATENYAQLNREYTASFHEQENRIASITQQSNEQLQQLNNKTQEYFEKRDKRCAELEHLYEEKLALQAPAKYWDEMEGYYTKKGRIWLWISICVTVFVIAALIVLLSLIPNIFSEDSHWFDIFKNSAIITVITSIAVYLLRSFVKITMSSFHLSRDAKERSKLTVFYLSLIEKNAVTDKERVIILNSLFSRADTGLLKGDSSPTMSANVTELIDSLNGR